MDAVHESDQVGGYRRYTGTSHTLLTLVPPTIGYLASVLFVFIGPLAWWANWLIAGAAWGVTKPARNVVRSALKYVTYEFRSKEFTWWTCVKGEAEDELAAWRREPWGNTKTLMLITALELFGWPVLIPLGATVGNQLDHG